MKTEKLDNLSRDELFQVIKSKSIKRAKHEVYIGLVFLVLLIASIILFFYHRPNSSYLL